MGASRNVSISLILLCFFALVGCKQAQDWVRQASRGGSAPIATPTPTPQCPGYPLLQNAVSYSIQGTGTALDPFLICTAEQLVAIGSAPASWTASFKLVGDIDLAAYYTAGGARFQIGSCGTGTCINGDISEVAYTGTFDGNSHTISNFTYVNAGLRGAALFGKTNGATIQNLTVSAATVQGSQDNGILAGYLLLSTITNCSSSGTITGTFQVGGLLGHTFNTAITSSSSSADVTFSINNGGGLVGFLDTGSTLASSSASGLITGTAFASGAGGLVGNGSVGTTITTSFASGNVTGTNISTSGGLVGTSAATISFCHATGAVSSLGGGTLGGLAGDSSAPISNSYATGDVSSTGTSGGLVGSGSSDITDSFATGIVAGAAAAGGLAGIENGNVVRCYATGDVTATVDNAGGLIGNGFANIDSSFAVGNVTTPGPNLGLLGVTSGVVTDSYVLATATCVGGAACTVSETGNYPTTASFFNTANNPFTNLLIPIWDFTTIWQSNAGDFPTLR